MKLDDLTAACRGLLSLPVRGAWIEIGLCGGDWDKLKSLPVRGAWIEIANMVEVITMAGMSLPVRGAWIEMTGAVYSCHQGVVAPRAGSVD